MGTMPTIRLANLTPLRFEGWARGTCDHGLAPGDTFAGATSDGTPVLAIAGPRTGLETVALDVHTKLEAWEELTLDLETSPPVAAGPLPADLLSHFGGPVRVSGVDMQLAGWGIEGAGWTAHLRLRVSTMFHVDVWLTYYHDQPWVTGEFMVTCSNAGQPDLTAAAPEMRLEFGDGVVAALGLPMGAPMVRAGETFGDGQARVIPFGILWPRHVVRPEQFASFVAAKDGAVIVRGCTRSFHDGNISFPQGFSARAWAAQHLPRAVALVHNWEPAPLGWAPDSGQTGAQEDQCFTGVESLLPDGAGAQLVNYLAALEMANRPCHHLEAMGNMVDSIDRPALRMFYSRPHHSGSDRLGKPRDLTVAEANGWNGPDAQHWFFSRLAMAARFTGSPACQRLLEHQARNYLIQLTVGGGATSAIWSSREIGWEGIAAVHLWRELRDRGLAERVRHHWHERAEWIASRLPTSGPWDVRVNDDRLGTGSWWMPWQQALGAYGIDLACRVLGDGGSHLGLIALRGAQLVVDRAWTNDGSRWVEHELLAVDGRKQRSGMFTTSWLPLALAVVLRHDPTNERAQAIWTQVLLDAGGVSKWIAPGVTKAVLAAEGW